MVQHPVKSIGRQHYIHAINAHENKPAWDFDYRLDRIIYNYVSLLYFSSHGREAYSGIESVPMQPKTSQFLVEI